MEIASLLKALADESRLRILWMVEERPLCVCEIQAVLGLAQSTVSRHLQILEDAGFLASERDGVWKNYRLSCAPAPLAQGLLAQVRLAAAGEGEARRVREAARHACRENLCGRPAA
ncbi:MAG: ArsR/SmtB family transcription factor [Deferrisomatales bacterium]